VERGRAEQRLALEKVNAALQVQMKAEEAKTEKAKRAQLHAEAGLQKQVARVVELSSRLSAAHSTEMEAQGAAGSAGAQQAEAVQALKRELEEARAQRDALQQQQQQAQQLLLQQGSAQGSGGSGARERAEVGAAKAAGAGGGSDTDDATDDDGDGAGDAGTAAADAAAAKASAAAALKHGQQTTKSGQAMYVVQLKQREEAERAAKQLQEVAHLRESLAAAEVAVSEHKRQVPLLRCTPAAALHPCCCAAPLLLRCCAVSLRWSPADCWCVE
jgi:hypothetical protein